MTAQYARAWGDTANPLQPSTKIVPRLPAYRLPGDETGLRVWCRFCERWHYHGGEYGRRAAHCHDPDSPYKRTGYVLVDPGK